MAKAEKPPCAEIIWKIENFTYCWQEKSEMLRSSKFFVKCLDRTSWHLCLYPKGDDKTDNLGLYLRRAKQDEGNKTVLVEFELAVLENGSIPYKTCVSKDHSFSQDEGLGLSSFIPRSDIVKNAEKLYPKNVLTVRCKMWHVNAEKDCSTTLVHLRTIIPVSQCLFKWRIDLSKGDQDKTISISSLSGSKNFLRAKLSYIKHLDEKVLSIFIFGNPLKNYSLKCDIRAFKAREVFFLKLVKINKMPFEMFCRPLLTYNYLIDASQEYLVGKTVSLDCELSIISHEVKEYNSQSISVIESEQLSEWLPRVEKNCAHDNVPSHKSAVIKGTPDDNCSHLKSDILKMYQRGLLSNLSLQVESQIFPVHSYILSSRSGVFERMFYTEMNEMQEKILKIEDLDGNTVKKMLDYLYTDSPGELDIESSIKLYYAADKYELFGLKKLCSEYIMQNITICNVYEVLILAYRHNDANLNTSSIQFILENVEDIVLSNQFKTFCKSNPQLGIEVMQSILEHKFENQHISSF